MMDWAQLEKDARKQCRLTDLTQQSKERWKTDRAT